MNIRYLITVCSFIIALSGHAQIMPALHVDGNQLRDEVGNKVVLHGVADSPNPNANHLRWGMTTIDDSIPACIAYFDKVISAVTDNKQGACANVFRLHLDPVWTNRPDMEPDFSQYGEADISRFSGNRLKKYFKNLYWPIISKALHHGMYVIMRPPGVCQSNLTVGGDYQGYLIDVWEQLSRNDSVKKYSGQISFELASQPVRFTNVQGKDNKTVLHDFFQPIIDVIRGNGFDGVLWAPGSNWQTDCRGYVDCPLVDENLGFSVFAYNGSFGMEEETCTMSSGIQDFVEYVPVLYTNPIMVTEVDWSPIDSTSAKVDSNGNVRYDNYGTRATATTSRWGEAFRSILDYYGNIGMTISSSDSYVDVVHYMKSGEVQAGINGVPEACGEPLFEWYKDWAKSDYPSTQRYNPYKTIPEDPFAFNSECFTTKLLYENSYFIDEDSIHFIALKSGGSAGWRYDDDGLDLSMHDSLIIDIETPLIFDSEFKIYDTSNFWAEAYSVKLNSGQTHFSIPLHNMVTDSGHVVDESRIRLVAFTTSLSQNIQLRWFRFRQEIYNGVDTPEISSRQHGQLYDLTGRAVSRESAKGGIYISDGKKCFLP